MPKIHHIAIHPQAPAKPAYGKPCNGCGVCCAAEPCPVAMLLLGQWRGHCRALRWQASEQRYVCGMVSSPEHFLPFLPKGLRPGLARWCARRIAAGSGCDSQATTLD